MGTLEATLLDTVSFFKDSYSSYADAQTSAEASYLSHQGGFISAGQWGDVFPYYTVRRSGLRFDLSVLSSTTVITAATLKIYGTDDRSTDDFDVTVVDGDFQAPPIYSDYSKGGSTDYGSINTVACSVGSYNDITINATGLAALNAALLLGEIEFYIRSGEDISASEPVTQEYYGFTGYDDANPPVLELTYSSWGEDVYPAIIVFPLQGRIDLASYAVIKDYLEGLDRDLTSAVDGDGNVDLAVDNWITWTGTSEKIAYDDASSRVTVTTLASTSIVTLVGDLTTVDLTIDTTGSAVNATVGNNVTMSDAVYAGIQSVTVDNEITFSAQALAAAENGQGRLDMDSTEGDLVWAVRDDAQAGAKSDILADFSAM